jgi:hypothetical protein
MLQPKIKPRYEVEKLDGQFTVKRYKYVKDEKTDHGQFVREDAKQDRGYMVYFPNGSSVHVPTEKELERLGFSEPPDLIDMESGETVPQPQTVSLKEHSARMTKSRNNQSGEQE